MRGHRLAPVLLALAVLAGCAKPPPDLDAQPAGALALPLGERHPDTLKCGDGDCADWYRIEVPAKGLLRIEIGPGASGAAPAGITARLVDGDGTTLANGSKAGGVELRAPVGAGTYLVEIQPVDREAPLDYALVGRFKAAPPPPAPPPVARFETRRAAVLEIEGARSQNPTVLLDVGEAAQLRPGMRGVLIDAGKKLADVVIVNVYPDGSRARIEGVLAAPISPRTVAEIRVPLGPPAGPDSGPAP